MVSLVIRGEGGSRISEEGGKVLHEKYVRGMDYLISVDSPE